MSDVITVLTGAGISADSGLSTFRGSGGLWQGYDVQELATPQAWKQNPEKVLEFYNMRRQQTGRAEPNPAHESLVKLEQTYDSLIITQNIDDLHERAGSEQVLHLHGNITKARSEKNPDLVVDIGYEDIRMGDTAEDGEQLRPHVVWFGERVHNMEQAAERLQHTDILIVIGTSLKVYPAAGLADLVPPHSSKYLIDPSTPDLRKYGEWTHYQEGAARGTPKLVNQLISDHNIS